MHIRISLPAQTLELFDARGMLMASYPVSTAKSGAGEQSGSFCTPRGRHIIRAKVGAGATANTVFVRRRPTGELWTPELAAAEPDRDWILTRILWLSGREPGKNRLGGVDTMRRYIYIHGSPDSAPMGVPESHGCIRMRNADIIDLFDRVPPYTPVDIVDYRIESGDWATLGAVAMAVRARVFILEQGVPAAIEHDAHDATSRHVVAFGPDNAPIGTGRLLPDGHIGRLAVLKDWRGRGVGAALFERLLNLAADAGMQRLELNAQTPAAGFYARYGFTTQGAEFKEAGLPHIAMARQV
jgi:predicted GNAT family N-acyltransferase